MRRRIKIVIIVGIVSIIATGSIYAKKPDVPVAFRNSPKYFEAKKAKGKPEKTRKYVEGEFDLDAFVPVTFPHSTKPDGSQKVWREYCRWLETDATVLIEVGWRDSNGNRPFPPDAVEEALWSQYFGALLSDEEGKAKIKNTYLKDVKP